MRFLHQCITALMGRSNTSNNWEYQTGKSSVGHSKKGFLYFFFLPYFACSLRYTLIAYSKVRPKSTNHHSHSCNYCINTKQHTSDTQNAYDLNEKNLQHAMARKTNQKAKTFTAKKVTCFFLLFFFPVSFGFICCSYMMKNRKTGATQEVNGRVPRGGRPLQPMDKGTKMRQVWRGGEGGHVSNFPA